MGVRGRGWPQAARDRYANDLAYRPSLLAVTASSNRSKGDSDPAQWRPRPADRCGYVARWVAVKWRWGLAVDSAERAAVLRVMNACPARSLAVPRPAPARWKPGAPGRR